MPNLNKVMLIGNLTRDPQTKVLPGGTNVAEFGIAVNRKFKTQDGQEKEDVLFVDCSAFGKVAEVLGQYARKGKLLYVEGRLKLDQWEDKNGGGKRSKITAVVENFQFLSPKDDPGSADGAFGGREPARQAAPRQAPQRAPQQQRPASGSAAAPARQAAPVEPPFGDEQQFKEEDIPF